MRCMRHLKFDDVVFANQRCKPARTVTLHGAIVVPLECNTCRTRAASYESQEI